MSVQKKTGQTPRKLTKYTQTPHSVEEAPRLELVGDLRKKPCAFVCSYTFQASNYSWRQDTKLEGPSTALIMAQIKNISK